MTKNGLITNRRLLEGTPVQEKNKTDHVDSTDHVPLRDVIAFVAVMNRMLRPFLAARGHREEVVDAMHAAWQKLIQMQIALWVKIYMESAAAAENW